jgi:hypothetical protein
MRIAYEVIAQPPLLTGGFHLSGIMVDVATPFNTGALMN